MKKILFILLTFASATMLFACGEKSDKFKVVASTTMLGDLVKQIGKDKVEVTTLFGEGVDPHLADPKAADTKNINDAKLVFFSGIHLEAKFGDIIKADTNKDKMVVVGDTLPKDKILKFEEDGQEVDDPHFWFSVPLWKIAARKVGDSLKEKDAKNKDAYEENTVAYIALLDELHTWINTEVAKLTKEQRVLVTAHDAFNYFASEYDFEVAAIDGISTEGETSASDITEVANIIIEKGVKAIFIESSIPATTVNSVKAQVEAKGKTVNVGGELYSDSLGTGDEGQYIVAFKKNVTTIVNALK